MQYPCDSEFSRLVLLGQRIHEVESGSTLVRVHVFVYKIKKRVE